MIQLINRIDVQGGLCASALAGLFLLWLSVCGSACGQEPLQDWWNPSLSIVPGADQVPTISTVSHLQPYFDSYSPLNASLPYHDTMSQHELPVEAYARTVEEDEVMFVPSECSTWHWHVRPRGFIYSTYWASAAEPRLATHLVNESAQGNLLDSHIAGRLGILRYGPDDVPEGWQLDVLGGAKLRQDWDDDLDVMATDYRYDILATYGREHHRFKLGFYHVSAHAGDEFLLKHPGFNRLNFYRDVFVAAYSYYPVPQFRVYGEIGWAFHDEISQPWEFQFGFDYGPAYETGFAGRPFIAMNAHLREEVDFGGNFAMQAGWAWKGDEIDGLLRIGFYYYDGYSPQFSFYAQNERQFGSGIWYDY